MRVSPTRPFNAITKDIHMYYEGVTPILYHVLIYLLFCFIEDTRIVKFYIFAALDKIIFTKP